MTTTGPGEPKCDDDYQNDNEGSDDGNVNDSGAGAAAYLPELFEKNLTVANVVSSKPSPSSTATAVAATAAASAVTNPQSSNTIISRFLREQIELLDNDPKAQARILQRRRTDSNDVWWAADDNYNLTQFDQIDGYWPIGHPLPLPVSIFSLLSL